MSVHEQLEIRSNEAGAFLSVRRDGPGSPHDDLDDGYWMVYLSCGTLQASLRFYEIALGGLADYFERLADDWRGWKGERRWASLEDDLELAASHDGLGTVTLTARLRTEPSRTTAGAPRRNSFWTRVGSTG